MKKKLADVKIFSSSHGFVWASLIVMISMIASQAGAQTVVADWKINEGSGLTLADSSGNGNTAYVQWSANGWNSTAIAANAAFGVPSDGLSISLQSQEYITLSSGSNTLVNNTFAGPFTIFFRFANQLGGWFSVSKGNISIATHGNWSGNNWIDVSVDGTSIVNGVDTFADGAVMDIVVTWNPTTQALRLYLNGRFKQAWTAPAGQSFSNTNPLLIARDNNAGSNVAWIESTRLYSDVLNDKQIGTLSGLVIPDVAASFDCSQNIGTIKSQLAGAAQGGSTSSYLKSSVVGAVNPLGLKLVRLESVPGSSYYNLYDPATGQYNWTVLDQEIENIKSTGAEIMLNVFMVPQWLSSEPNDPNWGFTLPSNMTQWKTLIGDIVRHVNITKGYNIKYWEFWNEPSGAYFFRPWSTSPTSFFNFYKQTVQAIKAVDSTALVGGFGDNAYYPGNYNSFFAYCKLYSVSIDFLTAHFYGSWTTGGTTKPDYFYSLPQVIRNSYYSYFNKDVPFFMTEWNSDAESQITTPAQNAAYMATAMYWMQMVPTVVGSCFFRVESYNGVDRAILNSAGQVRGSGRVLQMWGLLPSQLVSASTISPGISMIVARSTNRVVAFISRFDPDGTDPIPLDLTFNSHGLDKICQITTYFEDATTASVTGALGGTVQTSVVSSTESINASLTLSNYAVATVVIQQSDLPGLVVTPETRTVTGKAGTTTFSVSNVGAGTMTWTASVINGSSWLSFVSGGSGSNAGTITVKCLKNTSMTASRTGTIRILAPGAFWSPKILTVTQLPMTVSPGDANSDGVVDVGDLGILAANYGGSGKTWAQGDFNGDGLVDVGDLGILAANYGQGANATLDFNADYARAFGQMVVDETATDDALGDVNRSICSSLGLPLIAGFALMGLMLVKLEK
jgi:xylan 1,4-beta-xylosidase